MARGDEIVALIRRSGSAPSGVSTEVVGDARDGASIRAAIKGADAVIDTIGAGTLKKNNLESTVIAGVIDAMKELAVTRLIAMSAGMVARTNPVLDHLLKPTLFRHILAEHEHLEEIVRRSGLRWTLVRPPKLTNRLARGYVTSTGPRYIGSMSISRHDVARFIVDELARSAFIQQAVFVSSAP
jgi:putative NADH-flavin reductase